MKTISKLFLETKIHESHQLAKSKSCSNPLLEDKSLKALMAHKTIDFDVMCGSEENEEKKKATREMGTLTHFTVFLFS